MLNIGWIIGHDGQHVNYSRPIRSIQYIHVNIYQFTFIVPLVVKYICCYIEAHSKENVIFFLILFFGDFHLLWNSDWIIKIGGPQRMKPAGLNKPWPPLKKHHVCSLLDAVMCISACRWRLQRRQSTHCQTSSLCLFKLLCVVFTCELISVSSCLLSLCHFVHTYLIKLRGREVGVVVWVWVGPPDCISFLHVRKWLVLIQDHRFLIRLLRIFEYSKAKWFCPFCARVSEAFYSERAYRKEIKDMPICHILTVTWTHLICIRNRSDAVCCGVFRVSIKIGRCEF